MATLHIPPLLRDLVGGQERASVPGGTVAEALDALEAAYPGIKARLLEEEHLMPGMLVTVDGKRARRGLGEPVGEQSQVRFLLAVAGG
jgi:sulfur-carrier protein